MKLVEVVGWTGNAAFFSRFFVQWALSERAKKSVTPPVFWWLSLLGSVALGVYASAHGENVLLVGYAVNAGLYLRNLWLQKRARGLGKLPVGILGAIATLAALALAWAALNDPRRHQEASRAWLACAILGQAFWTSRFLVQWWHSERSGTSHFPPLFWWLSLAGNPLLLAYAVHLKNAVLIAGYLPGIVVQVRNLMLGNAGKRAAESS